MTKFQLYGTPPLSMSSVMHIFLVGGYPSTSGSLADPAGPNVIVAAISWLQATLLGTVATIIAIIAVSSIGLMMLTGRVPVRRGLTVIAGCFILFGAPIIAAGIQSSLSDGYLAMAPPPASPPPVPATLPPAEYPPANQDPYAGASVPR